MNQAPLKGFEKDVGSRTTHHILYPESSGFYHAGASLMLLPFKPNDFKWLINIFTNKRLLSRGFWARVPSSLPDATPQETYIIHPDFLHHVQTKWLGNPRRKYPSTGTIALILGFYLCDELHVMGFGINKTLGRWDHYYDIQQKKVPILLTAVNHLPDVEAAIREHMANDSLLSLYPGK
jgi:hypothetical protein